MRTASARSSSAHSRRRLVVPSWGMPENQTSYSLGGKGFGISRLVELGLPTPPALIISSSLSRAYNETGELPNRLHPQLEREIASLEKRTGLKFGDTDRPLIVSVRSGAMVSMPGMMDTVLNVGLTPRSEKNLTEQMGQTFVAGCVKQLQRGLGKQYPFVKNDAWSQLLVAIKLVLDSWHSPRAAAYRREHQIDSHLGTAITIQQMVFGNRTDAGESGTGVVTSHHLDTAETGLYGNYLPQAQGHDLVSGETTPDQIDSLIMHQPQFEVELRSALAKLQHEVSGPVEVEFTIENGSLYFLQFRKAKLAPRAQIIHLVRQKHAGRITREEAVASVDDSIVATATQSKHVVPDAVPRPITGAGTGIGVGADVGRIATCERAVRMFRQHDEPYILVRSFTTPDDFELMLGANGIVTLEGGSTCHAAMVARHLGIPAVIGITPEAFREISNAPGSWLTLDASIGHLWLEKRTLEIIEPVREIALFLRWKKAQELPTICPERCKETFSVHSALASFYLGEALAQENMSSYLRRQISAVHAKLTRHTLEVFTTYLALAVASEVTYAEGNGTYEQVSMLVKLRRSYTLTHRNAWRNHTVPETAVELSKKRPAEIAAFFRDCEAIFKAKSWGVCGGQSWANIAEVGALYWERAIPASVFIDRVFDLQHNTGTVFNKHPMVSERLDQHLLQGQLNIKRANLRLADKKDRLADYCDPELLALLKEVLR